MFGFLDHVSDDCVTVASPSPGKRNVHPAPVLWDCHHLTLTPGGLTVSPGQHWLWPSALLWAAMSASSLGAPNTPPGSAMAALESLDSRMPQKGKRFKRNLDSHHSAQSLVPPPPGALHGISVHTPSQQLFSVPAAGAPLSPEHSDTCVSHRSRRARASAVNSPSLL